MTDFDTLVLSGGGIKGINILGGIQAALDCGFLKNVNNYIGTSVGAIIGYLLAIGYTPIEIMISIQNGKWLEKLQNYDMVSMMNGNGCVNYNVVNEALEKLTLDKIGKYLTLQGLKTCYNKSLVCVTYNMTTCVTEYLSYENYPDLPCLTALRMSANIPVVFDRFKYMDSYYIDGGITDNFAIKKAEEIGTKILGFYNNISRTFLKDEPSEGLVLYILKLLQIPMMQTMKEIVKQSGEQSLLIELSTDSFEQCVNFGITNTTKLDMFSEGYTIARGALKKIN